jgi:hypothetical protein
MSCAGSWPQGTTTFRLAGRGLERVSDQRVTALEPQLRAVAARAADERIVPTLPLPPGDEELEEKPAEVPA